LEKIVVATDVLQQMCCITHPMRHTADKYSQVNQTPYPGLKVIHHDSMEQKFVNERKLLIINTCY